MVFGPTICFRVVQVWPASPGIQGVKIRSQVSTPCYTARQESVAEEEENHGPSSPTQLDFEQPEPPVGHQLNVMKKDFIPDHKSLGDDFDLKANKVKREAYKENHTKEQKIEVYTRWQESMKEISANIPFVEYFENHFDIYIYIYIYDTIAPKHPKSLSHLIL